MSADDGSHPAGAPPARRARWALAAGAAAFAASAGGFALYVTTGEPGWLSHQVDLQVYQAGGLIVRHAGPPWDPRLADPLYGWGGLPGLPLKFTYPPFAAVVFALVSFMSWPALQVFSVAANVALLLAALWFTYRGLGCRRGAARLAATLLTAAAALWIEPVVRTIFLGQINLALMALILWDLTGQTDGARRWWRGAGVGIAAGMKLVPLIFVPYLLLTRRPRQAAVAAASFAATVAVGFAALPVDSARWWLGGLFLQGGRTGFVGWEGNQSLEGLITRLAGSVASAQPLWLAAAALAAGAGLAAAALLHRAGHAMAGLLTCALAGLLASPVSWDHHWVWIAPAAAAAAGYAVRSWRAGPRRWAAAGYAGLAAGLCALYGAWPGSLWGSPHDLGPFSMGVLWAPPNTDPSLYYRLGVRPWFAEFHWHGLQLLSGNAFVLGGLALLALTLALAARGARAGAAEEQAVPAAPVAMADSGMPPGPVP